MWDSPPDPRLPFRRLAVLRSVLAVIVVAAASVIWRWGAIDVNYEFGAAVNGRFETVAVSVVLVAFVCWLFIALARRGDRLQTAALAAIPLVSILSAVIICVAIPLLCLVPGGPVFELVRILDARTVWSTGANAFWPNVAFVAWTVLKIGVAIALVIATPTVTLALIVMAPRSLFRSREVHPLMEPTLSALLAGYAAVRAGIDGTLGMEPAYPTWVAWCLTFGGPAVVVAMSGIQIVLMRRQTPPILFRWRVAEAADDPISRRALAFYEGCGRAVTRNHGSAR